MDTPLLRFSDHEADCWTLRDAYEGCQIFGRSGSGKSSGSGQAIAKSFLRAGMGGIVMCAKEDEADWWERYASDCGRSDDIIRFNGSGRWRFNFLEYSMQRDDIPADVLASNMVSVLQTVIEVASRGSGLTTGSRGDVFWEKSAKTYLTMAVDTLYAATGRVRLSEIMELINTAPKSPEQMKEEGWQESSFFLEIWTEIFATDGGRNKLSDSDYKLLDQFWLNEFPNAPEKTRGGVLATLRADLNPLLRGQMHDIFSTHTNLVPEMTHDGAIILLDFPTETWDETGTMAQIIFKYLWMRSTRRRKKSDDTRPVFYWADECAQFLSGYDAQFQSVCRSAKVCSVLLTQNLPSFYARIGGDQPEHTVNELMGNLRTKIFHNNDDVNTNKWATDLIGKETVWRASYGRNSGWNEGFSDSWNEGSSDNENFGWNSSTSMSDNTGVNSGATRSSGYSTDGEGHGSSTISYGYNVGDSSGSSTTTSHGQSGSRSKGSSRGRSGTHSGGISGGKNYGVQEQRDYAVEPHEFGSQLLTGGDHNGCIVTGVVTLPGRLFKRNGKHWMQVAFQQ